MRKYATPLTVILGETVYDGTNEKGRHVWRLPGPFGVVEHKVPGHPTLKRATPTYRGLPASLVRYARAQIRRAARKGAGP